MNMRDNLEKHLPKGIYDALRNMRQTFFLYRDSFIQSRRFSRSYSHINPSGSKQIETRIMFLTHQIEKGLSHSEFRYGFGKKIFNELPSLLKKFEQKDPEFKDNIVYQECASALREYFSRHESTGHDCSWQKSLFSPNELAYIASSQPNDGGSITIYREDKEHASNLTFVQLSNNRHSIREFADESVEVPELMAAIQDAMRTPSVCNRQPTRVHLIMNQELIKQALKIQGGVNGFATPPALILLTADLRVFISAHERNEGYLDGGLFGMSLLYALEANGLAACPLNTMFSNTADRETRKILDLPDYEVPLMYIEVGHFKEKTRTCKSRRFDADAITTVLNH